MFHSPHLEKLKAVDFLGQTTHCVSIIWCNANACSCKALVMRDSLFVSVTSEDGIDWFKEGLGGLGITVLP